MTSEFDYVIVGSGMNSLVCASLLSKKGASVIVLERESTAGGCIKTGEVTLPGFKHDLMSGFYPEFVASAAYAEIGESLRENGLEFLSNSNPAGIILPEGRHFILKTDREANIDALNRIYPGDGDSFRQDMEDFERTAHLNFGFLSNEVLSLPIAKLLFGEIRKNGFASIVKFAGNSMSSARNWVRRFHSEEAQNCFGLWALHAGMDIDSALSGYMSRIFTFAIEAVGLPLVKGGSENIVFAFESFLRSSGSQLKTDVDVDGIILEKGMARGVISKDGQQFVARKGVICNVTPNKLYGESGLLPKDCVPEDLKKRADSFRYGNGNMIIHLALERAPSWPHSDLANVAMLHITDGLHQTTSSTAAARNGCLPKRATIAVGQKAAIDRSRVPPGKFCLWLQLHAIPNRPFGDEKGEIETNGTWSESIREAYADRVLEQLEEFAPGLKAITLARNVYSPQDLENLNANLVGGDPYSGATSLDQFLLWRPLKEKTGHKTPIKNVYHIGASTHPGPGLGGGSGYLVGSALR